MGHRLQAILSLPLLALGALPAGCRDAEAPVAPPISGPRFSHVPGQGLEGRIAFHSNRDGDFEIFVMNADGSGVTQVTHNAVHEFSPIWSPTGQQIAFGRIVDAHGEVVVINVDGSGEQVLTDNGFPGAWSPDGRQIAFVSERDGDAEVFVMNVDGSGVTQLTHNDAADGPTAWSPNGEQIAFNSNRDGDFDIYVMNTDGTGVIQLTDDPETDFGDRAGWSPNGEVFAFSSWRDGDIEIYVMNAADGSGVIKLTDNLANDDDPVWSPDGEHIAFHSTRDGDEEIFVMNADGSGVTQLTFNEGINDAVPVWIQQVSPANDDFANATVIPALPFSDAVDLGAATLQAGEPMPSCSPGPDRTVWYAFTPTQTGWLSANTTSFFTSIAAHTGNTVADLHEVACRRLGERLVVQVEGNTTYYFQVGGLFGVGGTLEFRVEAILPPPNDAFVNATSIPALPFDNTVDLAAATTEAGEPMPSCFGVDRTAWYTFTPAETRSISASPFTLNIPVVLAVYRGNDLTTLTELGCRIGQKATFRAEAGTTYYFQTGTFGIPPFPVTFRLEVTPPPVAGFGFNPSDPSIFDVVQFFDNSSDPGELGFQSQGWNFGDGTVTTTAACCVPHQYAADGDYAVDHTVTTVDGRTASTSQTVLVRTHDVSITRFSAPLVANTGQTRRIVVGLSNRRYDETVEVQLFKSAPEGFQLVGSLTQVVPVRPANRTTDFSFSHTFTEDEARIGKVTFKAVAVVISARDALLADNEAIAAPTKVSR